MATKKEKTTMQKMTYIVSWGMLIALILGVGIPLVLSLQSFFK